MNAFEITQTVTLIANYIARQCPESIDLLGALFTQLGDTLSTIGAVNSTCEKN